MIVELTTAIVVFGVSISRPLKSAGHVTCLDLFVFEGGGVEAEVEVAEKIPWKLETGIYQP